MYQKWLSQCPDSSGFIPLGELMLTDTYKKLQPRDIFAAHKMLKNLRNSQLPPNFTRMYGKGACLSIGTSNSPC